MTTLARAWRRLTDSDRPAGVAMATLGLLLLAAIAAPWLAPQDPTDLAALSLRDARLPPGQAGSDGSVHLLGTDAQGRDVLSAILHGVRLSLQIGILAVLLALATGGVVGLVAAQRGGWSEAVAMRLVDLLLAFPTVFLALVTLAVLGAGRWQMIGALVVAESPYFARVAYGAAVVEGGKEYIRSSYAIPLPGRRIVFRHLLPNCMPPLVVVGLAQCASAISVEATLSFLGLGLPPTEPSLGILIGSGFPYMMGGRYWMSVFPGLALVVLVVAINVLGDRIQHVLDPRAGQ